jgi:uncharacterized protein
LVLKGQFLERLTLIPVGKLALEGLWHRGDRAPALLIVPPPPEEGGSMDHVVGAELSWAAARAGHATLRFNFKGVGASQGTRGDEASCREDLQAALETLLESAGVDQAVVAGVEGAARPLQALHAQPSSAAHMAGACFVAPPGLDLELLERARTPALVVVGQQDGRLRRADVARSLAAVGGRMEVIVGADAGFLRHLPHMGRTVAAWLDQVGVPTPR